MTSLTKWSEKKPFWQEAGSSIPPLVLEILKRRLSSSHELIYILDPSFRHLRAPETLTDIDLAVERLCLARHRQEKVLLYGDFDLDGTSAVALLEEALLQMGFENIEVYQPLRLKQGYGLHADLCGDFKKQGINLVVTVDVGITAIEAGESFHCEGIDLIITDHHLPGEVLPRAHAVINPNRADCTSDLKHLCGAGVAFYLAMAVRRCLLEQKLISSNVDPREWLDLFTIGTLTDLVPLVRENRILVKHGLKKLSETKRPGLRLLLEKGTYSSIYVASPTILLIDRWSKNRTPALAKAA
jgi:single-stranded-DNA-specific exonuclease